MKIMTPLIAAAAIVSATSVQATPLSSGPVVGRGVIQTAEYDAYPDNGPKYYGYDHHRRHAHRPPIWRYQDTFRSHRQHGDW